MILTLFSCEAMIAASRRSALPLSCQLTMTAVVDDDSGLPIVSTSLKRRCK